MNMDLPDRRQHNIKFPIQVVNMLILTLRERMPNAADRTLTGVMDDVERITRMEWNT